MQRRANTSAKRKMATTARDQFPADANDGGRESDRKGTQLLSRALAILAAFTIAEPQLTLSDLMRRTGVNKATLLRLITTLLEYGFLRKTEAGLYHIGPAVLPLGRLYRATISDADLINRALADLVMKSGESASFHVRDGDKRLCLHRVNSQSRIRDHAEVGDVLPIEKGAIGRVLVAFTSSDTTTELRRVRADFCCPLHGDVERDAAAVAVPVFGENGLFGALAVTGPSYRFDSDATEQIRKLLFASSLSLSEELGGDVRAMRQVWGGE
jgi:DNA-binding IclR family transcriptional regulator